MKYISDSASEALHYGTINLCIIIFIIIIIIVIIIIIIIIIISYN